MKFLLVSLISVLAFSSCATTAPKVDLPPFNYEKTKRAMRAGKNTVKGSGFLRQAGGGIVRISGEEVGLFPATEYSSARVRAIYGNVSAGIASRNALPKAPSAYYELGYKTIADVDGRFEFNNVADGFYFCTTQVRWLVNENRYAGGGIMKFVDVRGGKTVNIVVSGR